jgi:hypothetical protein
VVMALIRPGLSQNIGRDGYGTTKVVP